jgi:isopenicillin N synthase-like dioxygenase
MSKIPEQSKYLIPIDYKDPDAAIKFSESLHRTGFGVLVNHPLQQENVEKIYNEWKEFYTSSDAKLKYTYNQETFDGYFSPNISEIAKNHKIRDMKEFFHVYPWGMFPDESELKDNGVTKEYFKQSSELASELLQWVDNHSPSEVKEKYSIPLPDMIKESGQTMLRVLHYPPLDGNPPEGAMRAAPHGDINLLTIIPAASTPGLQVLTKEGLWYDVPCDFGMLIVNIGDMLDEASGGYYPSTTHRVVYCEEDSKKSRMSLPLFLHPRPDVVLSNRYTAGSFLSERLIELGNKVEKK